MLNYLKNLNRRTKKARGWLIVAALILYLFPFYSLALNKWPGWNWGELYTLGLELKDFLTVWTTLGGVFVVVIGIIQTQVRISQQKDQFQEQQRSQQDHFDAQRELQLKEQRDARFASGVELLGNPHESTRIGGAYNLYFLAREFPDDYLNPVCEILCAHLRSIAHKDKFQIIGLTPTEQRSKYPRNEVQTIIDLLFKERDGETIFKDVKQKNLSQIYLHTVEFKEAKLSHVDFDEAELSNIDFWAAKLNHVYFNQANSYAIKFVVSKLTKVCFEGTGLKNSHFEGAKLNSVDFSEAQIKGDSTFMGTRLFGIPLKTIVMRGHSLKLTAESEE